VLILKCNVLRNQ